MCIRDRDVLGFYPKFSIPTDHVVEIYEPHKQKGLEQPGHVAEYLRHVKALFQEHLAAADGPLPYREVANVLKYRDWINHPELREQALQELGRQADYHTLTSPPQPPQAQPAAVSPSKWIPDWMTPRRTTGKPQSVTTRSSPSMLRAENLADSFDESPYRSRDESPF
eukprot:TRINITY_DN8187_c0_g1_i2.p1 TRINITY_DN8187_c0_g1~~TRINITY_DN8187_c0_g1_i2.p1  ORF type:complete len:167 (+),score=33.18 TRINITY_DN8187_c0_g1_i2:146-646(+)